MKETLLAGGGVLSALAASACCVVPLALVSTGVGGAWIGMLAGLAPYQPVLIAVAVACLAVSFWLVYRPRTGACAARNGGRRLLSGALLVKGTLWLGTGLVAVALGLDSGLPLF